MNKQFKSYYTFCSYKYLSIKHKVKCLMSKFTIYLENNAIKNIKKLVFNIKNI